LSPLAGIRVALVVFVVAILQVSAFSGFTVGRGGPDVLLVALVSIALLRGSITGAIAGFAAGLIVDIATLGTLGVTSLLLTLAGYWAGRYGETTGRGRIYAPLIATVGATVLVEFGGYGLHVLLGESISGSLLLVAVPATLVCNALLAFPVFALVRRIVGTTDRTGRAREVELFV
jgi:rod shape-determining protein MreD